jgi:hypothetical protein
MTLGMRLGLGMRLLMALVAPSSLTCALSVLLVPPLIRGGSSIVRFESPAEVAEDYYIAKEKDISLPSPP